MYHCLTWQILSSSGTGIKPKGQSESPVNGWKLHRLLYFWMELWFVWRKWRTLIYCALISMIQEMIFILQLSWWCCHCSYHLLFMCTFLYRIFFIIVLCVTHVKYNYGNSRKSTLYRKCWNNHHSCTRPQQHIFQAAEWQRALWCCPPREKQRVTGLVNNSAFFLIHRHLQVLLKLLKLISRHLHWVAQCYSRQLAEFFSCITPSGHKAAPRIHVSCKSYSHTDNSYYIFTFFNDMRLGWHSSTCIYLQ